MAVGRKGDRVMFATTDALRQYHRTLTEANKKRTWERDDVSSRLTTAESELNLAKQNESQLYEVRDILQDTATQSREHARDILQSTVTTALQYIFGVDYSCNIHIPDDTLKPEAHIYIVQNCNGTLVQTEPVYGRGGGVVDVVSLALRAAMIQLQNNPPTTGPIILDEPGKHVSAQHGVKLAQFIEFLSRELNRQIILTTHNMDIAASASKVFTADITSNATVMTELGVTL
jgi:DNA repair exonuclease SbcCD ATPase subunit